VNYTNRGSLYVVTAVIPTTGRKSLRRAVESVVRQTVPVWPLVVLDEPEARRKVKALLSGLDYELVVTPGKSGGGGARNMGVEKSRTEYVAFLDDDDEWLNEKTESQLAFIRRGGSTLVSCRSWLVGDERRLVPERLYDGSRRMATYLLDRSTVRLRRNFMQSSSLLLPRSVAASVSWDPDLQRHQDWDFLIRAEIAEVSIAMLASPLVIVHQASENSISKSANWRASEAWLHTLGDDAGLSSRSRADFFASVILRGAMSNREWRESARLVRRALLGRCHAAALFPALAALRGRRP